MVRVPLQVVGQADSRGVPPFPLLGQRLHHDPVQLAPHQPRQPRRLDVPVGGQARRCLRCADPARRRRRLDLADDTQHFIKGRSLDRLAGNRRRAGQELVEDHAQGVDVGPGVDVQRVKGGLLRRHVPRRTRDAAERGKETVIGQPHAAGGLGQPEVDHLGDRLVIVGLDQNVRRLQIAMDDPLLVRVLHSRADLPE